MILHQLGLKVLFQKSATCPFQKKNQPHVNKLISEHGSSYFPHFINNKKFVKILKKGETLL